MALRHRCGGHRRCAELISRIWAAAPSWEGAILKYAQSLVGPAANKGIGFGIAKLLAEQGLTTVVAARNGKHSSLGYWSR